MNTRRLSEDEYYLVADMQGEAAKHKKFAITIEIIKQMAFADCKREEIIGQK